MYVDGQIVPRLRELRIRQTWGSRNLLGHLSIVEVITHYVPEERDVAEEPTRQPSGVAREKIRVRQIIGHICRGREGVV